MQRRRLFGLGGVEQHRCTLTSVLGARDELAGRVAIVTGGAAGIGFAAAERFAEAGAVVVLGDCDEARGTAAAAALVGRGRVARYVRADIAREDDMRALVADTVREFGTLDVLFNNAGIAGAETAITDIAADDFVRVLSVNLAGTFYAMKHAIAAMLAGRGGAVVNNASMWGLVGQAKRAAYCASKGGVIQLTRVAALEYATRNVRVNCICPGFVDTGMFGGPEANPLHVYAKVMVPMARVAQAAEIAELALFLASDRSSYMTGAALPVDGGYVAR